MMLRFLKQTLLSFACSNTYSLRKNCYTGDIPWSSAQCCGEELQDNDLYTCCDGNRRIENIFGSATECCGIDAINVTSSICCNGVGVSRTGGTEDECCGESKDSLLCLYNLFAT